MSGRGVLAGATTICQDAASKPGTPDSASVGTLEKHPDIPHVPAIMDFAKSAEDRQVIEFLFAPQEMGRPFFAPPDVPADRVAALRTAFAQTLKDPKFLEEAEKQGVEVQLVAGEAIQKLIDKIYAVPPHVIERAKAAVE